MPPPPGSSMPWKVPARLTPRGTCGSYRQVLGFPVLEPHGDPAPCPHTRERWVCSVCVSCGPPVSVPAQQPVPDLARRHTSVGVPCVSLRDVWGKSSCPASTLRAGLCVTSGSIFWVHPCRGAVPRGEHGCLWTGAQVPRVPAVHTPRITPSLRGDMDLPVYFLRAIRQLLSLVFTVRRSRDRAPEQPRSRGAPQAGHRSFAASGSDSVLPWL